MDLTAFPGGDLVQEGLADLARGEETIPALLVSIGAPRLRRLGLPVPETAVPSPEHRLYEKLAESDPDSAHSRYNALVRRLVSFENAAEWAGLYLEEALAGRPSRSRLPFQTAAASSPPQDPWHRLPAAWNCLGRFQRGRLELSPDAFFLAPSVWNRSYGAGTLFFGL